MSMFRMIKIIQVGLFLLGGAVANEESNATKTSNFGVTSFAPSTGIIDGVDSTLSWNIIRNVFVAVVVSIFVSLTVLYKYRRKFILLLADKYSRAVSEITSSQLLINYSDIAMNLRHPQSQLISDNFRTPYEHGIAYHRHQRSEGGDALFSGHLPNDALYNLGYSDIAMNSRHPQSQLLSDNFRTTYEWRTLSVSSIITGCVLLLGSISCASPDSFFSGSIIESYETGSSSQNRSATRRIIHPNITAINLQSLLLGNFQNDNFHSTSVFNYVEKPTNNKANRMSQVGANGDILSMFVDIVYLKKDFGLIYPQHLDFSLKSKTTFPAVTGNSFLGLKYPRSGYFLESEKPQVKTSRSPLCRRLFSGKSLPLMSSYYYVGGLLANAGDSVLSNAENPNNNEMCRMSLVGAKENIGEFIDITHLKKHGIGIVYPQHLNFTSEREKNFSAFTSNECIDQENSLQTSGRLSVEKKSSPVKKKVKTAPYPIPANLRKRKFSRKSLPVLSFYYYIGALLANVEDRGFSSIAKHLNEALRSCSVCCPHTENNRVINPRNTYFLSTFKETPANVNWCKSFDYHANESRLQPTWRQDFKNEIIPPENKQGDSVPRVTEAKQKSSRSWFSSRSSRLTNESFKYDDQGLYDKRNIQSAMTHAWSSSKVKGLDKPFPAVFNGVISTDEDHVPTSIYENCTFRMSSFHVKKNITTDGGVIKTEDFVLQIGAGCLRENTEITLIKCDNSFHFQSLLEQGLVATSQRVVEFLPDGLEFVKPANLTIEFRETVPDFELFILHGSHRLDNQSIVWEIVPNDVVDNKEGRIANAKINGFCLFSYIFAQRGKLARILSHFNHLFTCCAFVLYRKRPSVHKLDIVVVIVSEFVEDGEEENIKQLKDHIEEGYERGEKGMLKRVHTNRSLVMSLVIPGVECMPYVFKLDLSQLDSVGFVVNNFRGIASEQPENGTVKISEFREGGDCLWEMDVRRIVKKKRMEEVYALPDQSSGSVPQVVHRTEKLKHTEINLMSREVGVDWDGLGGLMDIPYAEREEVRQNFANYPKSSLRAGQMLAHFNKTEDFCRLAVGKCLEELGRHDVKNKMLPMHDETQDDGVGASTSQTENTETVELENTTLSPREMFRLSLRIAVDWDRLAALMNINRAARDDIRYNFGLYHDHRARAEKILSIFNHKENFSRKELADFLKEIGQEEWVEPILTGKLKIL